MIAVSPNTWLSVRFVTSSTGLFLQSRPPCLQPSLWSVVSVFTNPTTSLQCPRIPQNTRSKAHQFRVWSTVFCLWLQRSLSGWDWPGLVGLFVLALSLCHFSYSFSRQAVSIHLAAHQSVFSFHTVTRVLRKRKRESKTRRLEWYCVFC